ncbi:e3 ubiquitin-protein ligase znrf3 [Limosa lapponica baueri]|uniref:RING-type E3 ubiquitin transferase n=1 Tax=Limosa lapponica baueri TaxID=1758121 RepID=A0A2I0TAW7_LIMLA|nr:e3 ubiquitin-protein ligase znrf3 [Limosa lapponica baueri]
MHPLGLCNSNDEEDLYEYGWVGVVKLEQPELEPKPCLTVLGKEKCTMADRLEERQKWGLKQESEWANTNLQMRDSYLRIRLSKRDATKQKTL